MKNVIIIFSILLLTLSVSAQEVISSQKTVRPNEAKVQFRHFHDDLKINDLSNTFEGGVSKPGEYGLSLGNLQILKGEEIIVKKFDPVFLQNTGTTKAKSLLFKDDRLAILNTSVKDKGISVFIQEYDYTLNKLGSEIKIYETSLEIDEKSKGINTNISKPSVDIHYNPKNETILLELKVWNSYQRSFLTLNVLNKNFEEKSSITLASKDHNSSMDLVTHKILDNGEVLAIVQERDGYGLILSYNLVHLANDGSNNHIIKQIPPAKERIISSKISENSYDDNIIVTLLSSGTLKNKDNDNGALTAYKYNLESGDLDQITYAINRNDVLTGKDNNLQNLRDAKVEFLTDGSALFYLIGSYKSLALYNDRSIIVIKVNKDGEFQWLNTIERNSKSVVKNNTVGHLFYFNEEGDLEIIFNTSKSFIKGDSYSPKLAGNPDYLKLGETVKPVKAKINLETGDMEIKAIKFNSNINSLSFSIVKEMEEKGVYKILHNKGKDPFISVINFKD